MRSLLVPPVNYRPIPPLTYQEIQRYRSKQLHGMFGPLPGNPCTVIWGGRPDEWNAQGYGRFLIFRDGKRIRIAAHRLAYYLATGEDPGHRLVRHYICDFRPCNTPHHLLTGTREDNVHDMLAHHRANHLGLRPIAAVVQAAQAVLETGENSKLCINCGNPKELREFDENPANLDGLEFWCRLCCGATQIAMRVRTRRKGRLRLPA